MENRPPKLPGETDRQRLDRTDPRFHFDLEDSKPYVAQSAEWFKRQGKWVVAPGTYTNEKGKKTDLHDIWAGRLIAVCDGQEVKSRSDWNFRNLHDFTTMGGRFPKGTLATVHLDTYYRMMVMLNDLETIPKTYQQWSEDCRGMIEIDVEETLFATHDGIPIWGRGWKPSPKANCDKVVIQIPIFTWHGRPVMMGRELKAIYMRPEREILEGLRPSPGVQYVNESMLQARADKWTAKLRRARRILEDVRWILAEKVGDKFVEQWPLDEDPGDPKTRQEEREKKQSSVDEEVARLF